MLPNSEDNMMKIISARCSLRGRDLLEDVLEAAAAPGMSPQSGESLVVSQRRNMSPWQPETRRTTGTTSAMPRLSSSARLVLGRVQLLRWSIISLSSNHFLTSEVRGQQIQFSPHSDYEEIRILPKLGLWLLNSGGKLSRLCTAGRAVSVLALGNRLCLWFKVIFWVSSGGLADDLVVPRHQRGGVAPISKLRAPHGGRLHPRVRRQQPRLLQLCPAHEVRETQIFFSSSKYFSLAGTKSWCHEACRTLPWWWWPTRWTFSPTRTPRREASWDKTSATRSVRPATVSITLICSSRWKSPGNWTTWRWAPSTTGTSRGCSGSWAASWCVSRADWRLLNTARTLTPAAWSSSLSSVPTVTFPQ